MPIEYIYATTVRFNSFEHNMFTDVKVFKRCNRKVAYKGVQLTPAFRV